MKEIYSHIKNKLKRDPYLSERQWATIWKDSSADRDAWNYITDDISRSNTWITFQFT